MGLLFIQAISEVDIPVMAAYLMLVGFFFVVINLIVDLLYYVVDPRLRAEKAVAVGLPQEKGDGYAGRPAGGGGKRGGASRRRRRPLDRKSVGQGKSVAVRVDHRGRRIVKKKQLNT